MEVRMEVRMEVAEVAAPGAARWGATLAYCGVMGSGGQSERRKNELWDLGQNTALVKK